MALNFTPPKKTITFNGGDLTLRGLSFPDLSVLVSTHRDVATDLYERFTGIQKENAITIDQAGTIAMDLVHTMPSIVAHIISVAADVPDRLEDVAALPFDVQAHALEEIAGLSFAMEGGLNSFLESMLRLASRTTRVVEEARKFQP